ncbi:PP2C family protein-serine/threonine phosphatase [uncultured Jatrophihabitans sp.]|uniref:PP2C family protein-serine/threonine phosphatase n=1 Tax=uncultured Jatrophihabitans sp. TaxID=1610747 RepID=UPI0035CB2BEE
MAAQWVRWLVPGLLLGLLAAADLSLNQATSVASLVVITPLVAAALIGARSTAAYGVVAVGAWFALSLHDHLLVPGAPRHASIIRGIGIAIGAVVAVLTAMNRERHEEQLREVRRIADVAQQTILREVPARLGATQLAGRYRSSARAATVGGDFYETIATPWGVRVLMGDVRGKGLEAVQLAAEVLGAFREWATLTEDIADLLERLHAAATRRAVVGDFVTASLVQIAPDGRCSAVSAGHPQPVLIRDGQATLLPVPITRPPLVFGGRAAVGEHALLPGDQLVLYTDGVTEARRRVDRAFFDDERLLSTLTDCVNPATSVSRLGDAVSTWTDGCAVDDFAIVGVQYDPVTTPESGAATVETVIRAA